MSFRSLDFRVTEAWHRGVHELGGGNFRGARLREAESRQWLWRSLGAVLVRLRGEPVGEPFSAYGVSPLQWEPGGVRAKSQTPTGGTVFCLWHFVINFQPVDGRV